MADIRMENNRLVMQDGDWVIVDGVDMVKQHIIVALNTFYKDWILDYTKGIDYAYGMRNTEFLEYDVKRQISGVDGVNSISDFSLSFNRADNSVQITAVVKTAYGNINLQENIYR